MISMTYGTMPSRDDFDKAFEIHTGDGDSFYFGRDPRVGDCVLSASELWKELERARKEFEEDGNEEAGSWCADVLSCLDFEWI